MINAHQPQDPKKQSVALGFRPGAPEQMLDGDLFERMHRQADNDDQRSFEDVIEGEDWFVNATRRHRDKLQRHRAVIRWAMPIGLGLGFAGIALLAFFRPVAESSRASRQAAVEAGAVIHFRALPARTAGGDNKKSIARLGRWNVLGRRLELVDASGVIAFDLGTAPAGAAFASAKTAGILAVVEFGTNGLPVALTLDAPGSPLAAYDLEREP